MKKYFVVLFVLLVILIYGCAQQTTRANIITEPFVVIEPQPATAPDIFPLVEVNDQQIENSKVLITKVVAAEPGWLVIHVASNAKPGPVIGYSPVDKGENTNLVVQIIPEQATETLFAMLHVDKGIIGKYEFPGEDAPAKVGETIVNVAFKAAKPEAGIEKAPEEKKEIVKEFKMTAERFKFNPSTITVKKGDKVKIEITSIDTTHGFSLDDFKISKELAPNNPVIVEFIADKIGTFTFRCNVPCGSGHSSMQGKLIVE